MNYKRDSEKPPQPEKTRVVHGPRVPARFELQFDGWYDLASHLVSNNAKKNRDHWVLI